MKVNERKYKSNWFTTVKTDTKGKVEVRGVMYESFKDMNTMHITLVIKEMEEIK